MERDPCASRSGLTLSYSATQRAYASAVCSSARRVCNFGSAAWSRSRVNSASAAAVRADGSSTVGSSAQAQASAAVSSAAVTLVSTDQCLHFSGRHIGAPRLRDPLLQPAPRIDPPAR
jgi:hypothetical protein